MPNPDDQLPVEPTHPMRRVAHTLDRVRGKIADLGLRPYRTFYILERVDDGEQAQGPVSDELEFYEFLPRPRVRGAPMYPASMAGSRVEGSVRLDRITRDLKREQLILRTFWNDDVGAKTTAHYGLLAEGQSFVELYTRNSEPLLQPFGWALSLVAINRRVPLGTVLPWPA